MYKTMAVCILIVLMETFLKNLMHVIGKLINNQIYTGTPYSIVH